MNEVISETDTMEIGVDAGNDGTIDHKVVITGKKQIIALLGAMFALGVAVGMGLISIVPL